jgi:hypothetical protein
MVHKRISQFHIIFDGGEAKGESPEGAKVADENLDFCA